MNHILIGILLPYLVGIAWYVRRGGRASLRMLVALPLVMAACALWAVVPDLPRAVGWHALYRAWADDPAMNLFFFHHAIDAREADSPLHLVLFFATAGGLLGAAWRELRLRETEADRGNRA